MKEKNGVIIDFDKEGNATTTNITKVPSVECKKFITIYFEHKIDLGKVKGVISNFNEKISR